MFNKLMIKPTKAQWVTGKGAESTKREDTDRKYSYRIHNGSGAYFKQQSNFVFFALNHHKHDASH